MTDITSTAIDVRTAGEYAAGHLEGAVNIDVSQPSFNAAVAGLDKSRPYFVYCHSGARSAAAVQKMKNAGFSNTTDGGSMQMASLVSGLRVVRL